MAKKLSHGGKRKGAGRPPSNPEGRTATIAASVPKSLAEDLDAYAKKRGWSRSRAVTEAIRRLLKAGRK